MLFSISFCLYRACFTHLISSNLSCNLCFWYYDQLVHFDKEIMQTYIVIVSGSILNVSTVHLNGIWHLIWCYLSKPVLGRHPVLSRHYSIPRWCPLNTGFTVLNLKSAHMVEVVFPWSVNFLGFFLAACSKVFRKASLSLMREQVSRLAKAALQYVTVFRLISAKRVKQWSRAWDRKAS